MDEQTKIIYHITDEETPYLITIPVNPDEVTLGDFTNVINKPGYRFFFKHMDEDIGVVKEEISDEKCKLPCYQGRVVSWLVPIEGAANQKVRRSNSQETGSDGSGSSGGGPPVTRRNGRFNGDTSDTSSIISDVSSVMSSEIDTTSVADSDEEKSARDNRQRPRRRRRRRAPKAPVRCSSYSSMTESSSSLNIINVTLDMETINFLGISILGSSDKDGGGIYIGKILKGGAVEADGRISTNDYILSVNDISFENMSNDEAVEHLKKILQKPGPIKLVIAKTNWDGNNYMDDLNQADYTDADTISLASTTLDPTAQWIQQQQGNIQGYFHDYYQGGQSMYSVPSTGSESPSNSQIGMDTMRGYTHASLPLSLNASMAEIVKAMSAPGSDLDVKERTWLKVTIPDAFIGLDVVNWLYKNVRGFSERKEARKYACNLLKEGYIKHTVNKDRFSEQCYYVFGDVNNVNNIRQQMKNVNLNADPNHVAMSQRSDPSQHSYRSAPNWQQQINKPPGSVMSRGSGETVSSGSELSAPRGLVGARPGPPGSVLSHNSQKGPGILTPSGPSIPYNQTPQYHQSISSYQPAPYPPPGSNNGPYPPPPGSNNGSAPGSGYKTQPPYNPPAPGYNQLSAKDRAGSISSLGSAYSYSSSVSGMSGRPLGAMPASVAGSSQSFRLASDNPLEYFSDAV